MSNNQYLTLAWKSFGDRRVGVDHGGRGPVVPVGVSVLGSLLQYDWSLLEGLGVSQELRSSAVYLGD